MNRCAAIRHACPEVLPDGRNKSLLLAIVADLRALGYGASDIARMVERTPERVRQILRDMNLSRPRLRSIEDLPDHMRERVLAFRNLQIQTDM